MARRRRIKRKAAVFMDIGNLAEVDLEQIPRRARRFGEIEMMCAYGNFTNWRFLETAAEKLFLQGVRLIHCPGWKNGPEEEDWKDAADELMMVDICSVLDKRIDIERFIVCSGDGHFLPALLQIRAKGREAIVMGPQDRTSRLLKEAAHRFVAVPSLTCSSTDPAKVLPLSSSGRRSQQVLNPGVARPNAGDNGHQRRRVHPNSPPPLRRPGLPPISEDSKATEVNHNQTTVLAS